MDNTELPLELSKAIEKAEKKNERNVRKAGYGASDLGMYLTERYLGVLADYIRDQIDETQPINSNLSHAVTVLGELKPEVIALAGLNALVHNVAMSEPLAPTTEAIGRAISAECFAAGITREDHKLAARIEKHVRERHSTVAFRQQAARSIARRAGYKVKHWSPDRLCTVGTWFLDCALQALPDLFETEQRVNENNGRLEAYAVVLKPDALAKAEEVVAMLAARNPVYQPLLAPPPAWTGWSMKHPDPRVGFGGTFLRTHYKDVIATVKAAMKDGSMKPAVDAVNALQGVPWRINQRIYGVMNACISNHIEVKSLPMWGEIPFPPKPESEEDLDIKQWLADRREVKKENASNVNERLLLAEDMQIADRLVDAPAFWTPMNCDWRGRVYGLTHFNFQREDRVRALFEFRDGLPIGEEGLWWLKVHVANCGDFDKISKRPLKERVEWVDKNIETLSLYAELPLKELGWTKADKPFLFLAACMELTSALRIGSSFITRLPVSFDGSCSGLQHLASMTRDQDTAVLVNLTNNPEPQDVYSLIADGVILKLQTSDDPLASTFLTYFGDDKKKRRNGAKRNVMTYSYSSKKFGMAGQQQVDLMDDLQREVVRGKLPSHPFEPHHKGTMEKPGKAARFLAGHVFDTIEERVHRPATAMKFLQSLAKALAHEGKPLRWTTPAGIPWINRYHEKQRVRLSLWLHDKGVKCETRIWVATGHAPEIDKESAANGVAPNFVHANDGSHLMLTTNACVAEGITNIATVHDSFGCLAPQAGRFNHIIRAEFVRMYETHDVLAEILERAKCDLTQHNWHRLPELPEYGQLNLKEIEHAQFAFA